MGRNFVAWLVAFLGLGSAVYTGLVPEKLATLHDHDRSRTSPKFALLSDLEEINHQPMDSEVERYHRVEDTLAKHTKRPKTLPDQAIGEQMAMSGGTRFIDSFLSDESVLNRLHFLRLSVLVPVVALASPQRAESLSRQVGGVSEHWSVALRMSEMFRRVSSILATQYWDSERESGPLAFLGLSTMAGVWAAHSYFEKLDAVFPGYGPSIANSADVIAGAAFVLSVAWELLRPLYMKRNLEQDWNALQLDKQTSLKRLFSKQTCELLLKSEPSRPLYHSIRHAN